jgi:hypothetical protein
MTRLLFLLSLFAALLFAADLSGTWVFDVVTDAGSGTPTFHLKQDGSKLTGDYSGALGEAKVTGTVEGSDVTIRFHASGEEVVYQGSVQSDGTLKGKVQLGSVGAGTFTAKKK